MDGAKDLLRIVACSTDRTGCEVGNVPHIRIQNGCERAREIIRFEISRDGLPLGEVLVPIPGLLPGPIKHLCEGVVVGVQ
ncbi:hypothetical protein HYQ46_012326 [Verticillium longisporum]|nr:hypothetical protein HYQ46_012326 [Verticillium longisporum]